MEQRHLFNVHLGETIAPYVALEPLKALLPLKQGDAAIPTDDNGPVGIRLGALERRMRERWRTISGLWETNKAPANRLNLLGQIDYLHKLSSQLEWQSNSGDGQVRVVYTKSGEPTAGLIQDSQLLVDHLLYWIPCRTMEEANYLLAVINSNALASAVNKYTTPNWAGNTRDLHKHLWKLPIPEFDRKNRVHARVARAGATAAAGAAKQLEQLREARGDRLTVTIARRELRKWLRASAEGRAVETAVGRLLAGQ